MNSPTVTWMSADGQFHREDLLSDDQIVEIRASGGTVTSILIDRGSGSAVRTTRA